MANYTPSTDFNFSGGDYTPSTDFDFTEGTPAGVITGVLDDVVGVFSANIQPQGVITGVLDDVVGVIPVSVFDNQAVINATLDDAVASFIGNYDPNVTRWVTSKALSVKEIATTGTLSTVCMVQEQGTRLTPCMLENKAKGIPVRHKISLNQDQGSPVNPAFCEAKNNATALYSKALMPKQQTTQIHPGKWLSNSQQASLTQSGLCEVKQQMTKVYPDRWAIVYQDSHNHLFIQTRPVMLEPPLAFRYTPGVDFSFTPDSYTPSTDFDFNYGQTGAVVESHSLGLIRQGRLGSWTYAGKFNDHKWCVIYEEARRPPPGKSPWVDLPRPNTNPEPPGGSLFTVPVQETYNMTFNVTATLEDLTPIEIDNISLSYDADSFAWQFSAVLLDASQRPLLQPAGDGTPVTLIITINTYIFHVLIENLPVRQEFGKKDITIRGRGLSAKLAYPYYQRTSGTQGSLLDIRQIADLHVPLDWTLLWTQVYWNVDGGAYSWQSRTPIEAITDIAHAAGAIVRPARDSKTLEVIPRYPVMPWHFSVTTPDVAIPDSVVLEAIERDTARITANGVYVHGGEVGGELGFCRLNGTAGDILLQTYQNALLTDVAGLRAMGERLLAGEVVQPAIESITLPLDPAIVPLLEIGTFIGVTIEGGETRGVVNSIAINVDREKPEITQTVRIGENTNNQWTAFKTLLPADPLLVGEVTNQNGNIATVTLIDGGVMNVRGVGTVGNKYYIRSGQLQGDAPNLTQQEIVI